MHLIKKYLPSFFYYRGVPNRNGVYYKRMISYSNKKIEDLSISFKNYDCRRLFSNTNDVALHWENAEDIADLLFEEYRNIDPLALRFEELENMIIDTVVNKNKRKLNGSCNEGVLENIQMNWLEKYNESNE